MSYRLLRSAALIVCAFGVVCAQEPGRAWLDVPFVKQVEKGCGSASIAMVMRYWDKQLGRTSDDGASAVQIQKELYVPGSDGIYASAMESYFEKHQFAAFPFRGDLDLLQHHLQKGRPLIAALKPSGLSGSLHYVVVVGVDRKQDLLLLNDPAGRKLLKQDRSEFEKQWKATDNWTLLAVPQTEGGG